MIEIEYKIRANVIKNKHTNAKLKKIFDTWFEVVNDYCEYENYEDSPYIYNERATLSSFVGAIWKTDERALEEFSALKGGATKKDNDKMGRVDLWFSCGSDSFLCEAKQKWKSPQGDITENFIESAKNDVKSSKKHFDKSLIPFAMTFWSPSFNNVDNIEKELENLHKELQLALQKDYIDMYCLVAPQGVRELKASNGKYYPCVILLGNVTDI